MPRKKFRTKEYLEQYQREWRIKNRGRINARQRAARIKNREKMNAYGRAWRGKKGPEYTKNIYLKSTFGISFEEYNGILQAQDNCCAICHGQEHGKSKWHGNAGKLKYLTVDHDHRTKLVRGLLCRTCNRALGMLRDDPGLLFAAYRYLIKKMPEPNPLRWGICGGT